MGKIELDEETLKELLSMTREELILLVIKGAGPEKKKMEELLTELYEAQKAHADLEDQIHRHVREHGKTITELDQCRSHLQKCHGKFNCGYTDTRAGYAANYCNWPVKTVKS